MNFHRISFLNLRKVVKNVIFSGCFGFSLGAFGDPNPTHWKWIMLFNSNLIQMAFGQIGVGYFHVSPRLQVSKFLVHLCPRIVVSIPYRLLVCNVKSYIAMQEFPGMNSDKRVNLML